MLNTRKRELNKCLYYLDLSEQFNCQNCLSMLI